MIPAKPDRGAYARTLAKGRAVDGVKAGRLTLLEAAAAFRDADRDNPDAPPGDLDAYCEQVIIWVRGPEPQTRPDLGDLLGAELEELRREGLLAWPR